MKFKTISQLAIIASTCFLTACSVNFGGNNDHSSYSERKKMIQLEEQNRRLISNLVPGQSLTEVKSTLGVANFSEFKKVDGKPSLILYYRTHRTHADGETTKDECTPLIFTNEQLVAWGESAL